MEIKKILWPTDFSGNAHQALPYVQSLTERYNAQVHVVYVIQDIAYSTAWYKDFDDKQMNKFLNHSKRSAKEQLDLICDKYMDGCPMYVKHVAVGDPAQEILKLIKKEDIDMVVMASRGEKGHFPFGSVSEKVMKNSPVPVTTIPVVPDSAA